METRYFQTLIMVAEKGSFSRAAEALNITQSAASQRIKFLEDRYGHQLLDRSGPSLLPTPAGELVLARAREIVEIERKLLEDLEGFEEQRRLSLCCTPTFGMAYLPAALNEFMLQNSDVADIKFIFHQPREALRGLQGNAFDLAIIEHFEECSLDAFEAVSLPRDELIFVSAPSLELPGSVLRLEDLLPHRLYARRDGCSSRQLLMHNVAGLGREIGDFRSVVISDDLRFTIQTVLDGGGVSFVSRSLVAAHLRDGRLRAHHVEGFTHFRCRSALLRRGSREESLMRAFLECVLAVFAERDAEACSIATAQGKNAAFGPSGLAKKAQSG